MCDPSKWFFAEVGEEEKMDQTSGDVIPIVMEQPKRVKLHSGPIKKFQVKNLTSSEPIRIHKVTSRQILYGKMAQEVPINSKISLARTSLDKENQNINAKFREKQPRAPLSVIPNPSEENKPKASTSGQHAIAENVKVKSISHASESRKYWYNICVLTKNKFVLVNNPELRFVARLLASMDIKLEKIAKSVTGQQALQVNLPLRTKQEVEELNIRIASDTDGNFTQNLIKYISKFVPLDSEHSSTGLAKIMTDQLMDDYNWEGSNGKSPLKNLQLFKVVLFEAWKNKYDNFKTYEKGIKKQIADSRNRQSTRKYRTTKALSSQY